VKTVAEGLTFYKLASSNEATMSRIARYAAQFGVACVQVRKIIEGGFDRCDAEDRGHFGLLGDPEAIGACLADLIEQLGSDIEGWQSRFEWAMRKATGGEIPPPMDEDLTAAAKQLEAEDIAWERERLAELTIAETPVNGGVTA